MTASTIDALLRQLVRDVIREELAAAGCREAPTASTQPQASSERQYLTPKEVAAEAGVSERTVRAWVKSGKLKARALGRLLRVDRAELARFLSGDTEPEVDTGALADELLRRRRGG